MTTSRARWIALVVLCIGTLMTILDETIVNVALPVMQEELGFSPAGVSWVINAYLIAYGGLLVFAGRLGDLLGHRRVLLIGVAIFTAASVSAGLSPSAILLVVSRFGQGVGAALITAVTLALIVTMFSEPREQTRAIGFYSFTFAGGGALGLLLGGVLMQIASWQWLFFINVPIGLVSLIVGWRLLPRGRGLGLGRGLDVAGAALLVSAVSLLVYGVITAEHLGWGGATLLTLGGAVILLLGVVVRQRRASVPLLHLGVLRDRDVAGANVVQFLVTGGLYGSFFIATLLLQQVLGYAPMQMALAFVPLTIVTAVASIVVAPFLTARFRERITLVVGLLGFLAGALLLARVPLDGGYLADVLAPLLLLGLGIGIVLPPIMGLAMSKAGEDEVGAVSGLANSTGMIGGAFWTAVVASLIGAVAGARGDAAGEEREALAQGLSAGSLAIAAVLVVALAVAFVVLRRRSDPAAPTASIADARAAG
ncbi:MFS transporter [Agromyces soli]|uniref:MFS transporter n=1 Tax=Agromyces soli TaxID=659012 RepID=A0ABY4AZL9_9MICO|nr:MFS transporter [Agromyces soli]UOE27862.1 MFS transporter [Agromyces soli]